jgi:hypothetical protein
MKTQIKKEQNFAFGKDVFLLGQDKEGIKYWLEAPKFDCGWYWGFGYVETYTNNDNPGKAKDINSHQHIDSSFIAPPAAIHPRRRGPLRARFRRLHLCRSLALLY